MKFITLISTLVLNLIINYHPVHCNSVTINYCDLEDEFCENNVGCDKEYPFELPQFNATKLTFLPFSDDEKIKYVRIFNKLKDDLELRRIGTWGNSRIPTLNWSDELENISKIINAKLGYNSNEPFSLCFNTPNHHSTTAVFDKHVSIRNAINDMERTFEMHRIRNTFTEDLLFFFGQINSVGCTSLQSADEHLIGTRCVYSFSF